MTTTSVLIRKDSKQSWNRAEPVPLLDPPKRLEILVEGWNKLSGFAKFKVQS